MALIKNVFYSMNPKKTATGIDGFGLMAMAAFPNLCLTENGEMRRLEFC